MKCLIDADILAYEISACGTFKDEATGETVVGPFSKVADLLDQRIKEIEQECWADEPSTLYLTGDEKLFNLIEKQRRRDPDYEAKVYKANFRKEVAKAKAYKGQRKQEKPFHFDNIRAYMFGVYDVVISDGCEADDLLAIELTNNGNKLSVTCCTRDKDLRMVPGIHFGWPCGLQPQFGPRLVLDPGIIALVTGKHGSKIVGEGIKFFYSQLITGDTVDNIPGLPRGGPKMAFELLSELETEYEMYEAVYAKYVEKLGDKAEEFFREQADLLWMCRGVDENGELIKYSIPTCKV